MPMWRIPRLRLTSREMGTAIYDLIDQVVSPLVGFSLHCMGSPPPCLHLSPHDNMNYVVDSMEFEDRWNTMLFTVSVNSTVSLLYCEEFLHNGRTVILSSGPALYVVLFLFSIRTLHRRIPDGKFTGVKLLLGIAWIMFFLATIGTIITISTTGVSMRMVYLLVQGYTDTPTRLLHFYHSLALGQDVILAVNNSALLKFSVVISLPYDLGITEENSGITCNYDYCDCGGLTYNGLIKLNIHIDPRVPFSMGGATNILLMCLTGMVTHTVAQDSSAEVMPQLVESGTYGGRLESGILYCICVIIYVISLSINKSSAFTTIFNGVAWGLVQLGVNIVPTLILVRVGLGRSTENTLPALSFDFNTRDKNRNF
ncbi:hypothetical protein DFH08DRAFT_798654 [Mycena albidolilacea]|uniref:Uncharacterized protein n=1 Tax=Mycena albidolilacea TaxID=1033008 RepID=A0AAD7AP05_9AGAR|nr:hypothetical protein DFH08DRAFT_798654 [Mycena albidolilacea]